MKTELKKELDKALVEIGEILPWWSEEDRLFVFEHPAYPMVMHADQTKADTVAGYHRALSGFIEERLLGQVAPSVERITSGRGGSRPGSGRPKGTLKLNKKASSVIRLPQDLADWLKDPEHQEEVRKLM